jgi:hypothetical protein
VLRYAVADVPPTTMAAAASASSTSEGES